jgi:hypothetical protein
MASADFCQSISQSLGRDSLSADWQISPGNAHLLSRLCLSHLRLHFPYKYRTLKIIAFSSSATASMRFLFVKPAICLRLPSDSTSRWTPLPSG